MIYLRVIFLDPLFLNFNDFFNDLFSIATPNYKEVASIDTLGIIGIYFSMTLINLSSPSILHTNVSVNCPLLLIIPSFCYDCPFLNIFFLNFYFYFMVGFLNSLIRFVNSENGSTKNFSCSLFALVYFNSLI